MKMLVIQVAVTTGFYRQHIDKTVISQDFPCRIVASGVYRVGNRIVYPDQRNYDGSISGD
jgi:hypothetical protein